MSSEETFEVTRAFISAIAAIMVHTDEIPPEERTTKRFIARMELIPSHTPGFTPEQMKLLKQLVDILKHDLAQATENRELLKKPLM